MGANLTGVDFSGAVLENISFEGSNFEDADLSDATFVNCDFSDSIFTNAIITNSNMQGSNFSNADMDGAILDESNFLETQGFDKDKLEQLASYDNTQFHSENEIIKHFSEICVTNEGKPDAKPFSKDDSTHHYVVITADDNADIYNKYDTFIISNANSIWETDTVICEEAFTEGGKTCEYNGGYTLDTIGKKITFSFLEAQSGNSIVKKSIYAGYYANCPIIWEFTKNRFHDTDNANYVFGQEQYDSMIEVFIEDYSN